MKTTSTTRLAILVLASALLAACGKGFDASSSGGDTATNIGQGGGTGGTGGNNGNSNNPSTGSSDYENLDLGGDVNGGNYDKEQVIALDKANNALLLYLPMSVSSYVMVNAEVPNGQGIRLTTTLDANNKARMAVSIPLRLIVRDRLTTLPSATKLPGDRPLPMMPSGEYPATALQINGLGEKLYLYIGVEAVGIYLENSFFPEIGLIQSVTAPIRNKAKTRVYGYLTILPKQGVNKGGLFLSFIMPQDIAVIIDDHLSSLLQ